MSAPVYSTPINICGEATSEKLMPADAIENGILYVQCSIHKYNTESTCRTSWI